MLFSKRELHEQQLCDVAESTTFSTRIGHLSAVELSYTMKTWTAIRAIICQRRKPHATAPAKEVNETLFTKHLVEDWRE